ncbi:DNA polymerase Y family protein [Christensenella hongkongensis]|uniref:DNA polymerase IV n=1 Tax=Christensenella hongkongensis TaxID=270498 RepID=A0A0M2NHA1_9FIRM|nr:DNA polymerase IV [Christensenella hongkongensis]KKI49802.1 DNA polymerase IV [Christensenella hongkongensis]TCW24217.1 DNA polymerase-4 [Christensenella hongkongensis]
MERIILHSDLNNFYASVECMIDPGLKNVPLAVCGSKEERHGIVLAKNQIAKRLGIKTGEVIWQAKQKYPGLVTVSPHMEDYIFASKKVHAIYNRFTSFIEPYGIDEAWLDVTGSTHLFGNGEEIAHQIKETIKDELGLTVSVGVSFTKTFAKLGSDYKKPDAVTVISKDNYKDIVWPLPVEELIFVGRATRRKLNHMNIHTIGEMAQIDKQLMKSWFGIRGIWLWEFANGLDMARICTYGYEPPIKSIGRGITCMADLVNEYEVKQVIIDRAQRVSHSMRKHGFLARRIQISVKDINLAYREYQGKLDHVTQSWHELANAALDLFKKRYEWRCPVRAITVRAIDLVSVNYPDQVTLFDDQTQRNKTDCIEKTIEKIREMFGRTAIVPALLLKGSKVPVDSPAEKMRMPAAMYR